MFLYPTILVLSFLLIAELPMFSFKFKNLQWTGNESRITFVIASILFLIIFKEVAFSLIIMLYVLLAVINLRTKSFLLSYGNKKS